MARNIEETLHSTVRTHARHSLAVSCAVGPRKKSSESNESLRRAGAQLQLIDSSKLCAPICKRDQKHKTGVLGADARELKDREQALLRQQAGRHDAQRDLVGLFAFLDAAPTRERCRRPFSQRGRIRSRRHFARCCALLAACRSRSAGLASGARLAAWHAPMAVSVPRTTNCASFL